jgi:hypothetical protein
MLLIAILPSCNEKSRERENRIRYNSRASRRNTFANLATCSEMHQALALHPGNHGSKVKLAEKPPYPSFGCVGVPVVPCH